MSLQNIYYMSSFTIKSVICTDAPFYLSIYNLFRVLQLVLCPRFFFVLNVEILFLCHNPPGRSSPLPGVPPSSEGVSPLLRRL